ncbi:MAG: GHMP kinase [Acidobacteriia bacterium]|nr:GHMP kinase [Terriglobia bacterium]
MIVSSAPFRISFAGGGSDLPVYYRRAKGAVLSATINKYIYISVHPYFNRRQTLLKYSQNEQVDSIDEIRHPIFREALRDLWPAGGLEIVSTADVPSGTGLGSSSSFTVALLHALYAYRGVFCSKEKLARGACAMEIERLGEPIGKQDQYAAAYGGLNFIEFNPDETVTTTPVILPKETATRLQQSLLLFYMGDQREASDILRDQAKQLSMSPERFENLARMVALAHEMRDRLLEGSLDAFARALHQGWELKRTLSSKIATSKIDAYYHRALEYGAKGGKLLGAGGGGFLMLYCEPGDQDRLRKAMFDCFELPFHFDWGGTRIVFVGERHTEEGFVT